MNPFLQNILFAGMTSAADRILCCFNRIRSDDTDEEEGHTDKYIVKPDPLHRLVFTLDAASLDRHEVDNEFPRLLVYFSSNKNS